MKIIVFLPCQRNESFFVLLIGSVALVFLTEKPENLFSINKKHAAVSPLWRGTLSLCLFIRVFSGPSVRI